MPRSLVLLGLALMLGGAVASNQALAGGGSISKERSAVQKVKTCATPRGWCEVSGSNEPGTACTCRIYSGNDDDLAKGTIVMRGVFDKSGIHLPLRQKAKRN